MCGKKPLTKEAAIESLRIIRSRRNNKKTEKRPVRKYYCTDCSAFHLTSKSEKAYYQFYKQTNKKHK